MTRITQRLLTSSTLANLQGSLGRTEKLQERLSTGKVLNRPSDSPTGLVTAMQTRASLARTETHLRNADNAMGWVNTADSALQGASSMLRRVRELAVLGQNGSIDATGREAIAMEVDAISASLVQVANTSFAGRSVFAGNAAGRAYDASGAYLGDDGAVERTVADGQAVRINVTGPEAFGAGPDSVFAVLAALSDDLRNNPSAITSDNLPPLDASINRVLTALGSLGARGNQIEGIRDRGVMQKLNLETRLSEAESTDMTETIMELQMQEVAYQAALGATARVLQPSLLDFLR
jgi:flagellar hook-associated protein 3 FlgL